MILPKITSAMLVVTHACPMKCRYCFVHQEPSCMSYKTAKDATDFLIKNAEEVNTIPSINFFGGEPTLLWDEIIVPLTKWIRQEYKKPFSLGITTNAVLLNEERLNFLKENNIGLLFSMDGAKETQDYNRPYQNETGTFDTIVPLIPKIVETQPLTTFRMTTIPDTCHHMFENIMFAEQHGFKRFFVMPNVFEPWSDEKRNIAQEEMRKYSNYYIDCMRNGNDPIAFDTFDRSIKNIRYINAAITQQTYRINCTACGKCGLGSSIYASIHPNGNVYGCQEMTSNEGEESIFYIGNIYTGIEDERRQALIELFDSDIVKGEDCENCKYNRICDGGCLANNYLLNGSLHKMPEVFCWWKKMLLEEAIYVTNILGTEENQKFIERWWQLP